MEVVEIVNRCASERWDEVNRILKTAREVRRIEKDIEAAEVLNAFHDRLAAIEEQKREALHLASERSKRMQMLLNEQKQAVDKKAAQLTTTRLKVNVHNRHKVPSIQDLSRKSMLNKGP